MGYRDDMLQPQRLARLLDLGNTSWQQRELVIRSRSISIVGAAKFLLIHHNAVAQTFKVSDEAVEVAITLIVLGLAFGPMVGGRKLHCQSQQMRFR